MVAVTLLSGAELKARAISFAFLMRNHLARQWVAYALAVALSYVAGTNYRFTVNVSHSLPNFAFLVHINEPVSKGDYAAYRWHGNLENSPFRHNAMMAKRVVGIPGDVVEVKDRNVYVNGEFVGRAKEYSRDGRRKLEAVESHTIPAGRFYMAAPDKDSFDSRYALVGDIHQSQVVGRAYPIF